MTDGEGDRRRREGENERFFGESSLILSVSGKLLSLRDFPSHTHNVLSVCLSDCCVYLLSRVAVVVVSAGVEFVWENGDTLLLLLLSTVLTAGASRFPGGDVGISVDCVCRNNAVLSSAGTCREVLTLSLAVSIAAEL